MKRRYRKNLHNSKRRIKHRLRNRGWPEQAKPMFKASNIHYETAERGKGVSCGGIGAIHLMVKRLGLVEELDQSVQLLKRHLPYHESDHVLNIAYNALLGGIRLEDIELRRKDEVFLNALGAQRIPDPTTSGDFTRRFDEGAIEKIDGRDQPDTARGVEQAGKRIHGGGVHRCGRDDSADEREVQRGYGNKL